jgi:hypothetical protein
MSLVRSSKISPEAKQNATYTSTICRGSNEFTPRPAGSQLQQERTETSSTARGDRILSEPETNGVFAAMENITSGALSVSERLFHSANPNTAGVPTS